MDTTAILLIAINVLWLVPFAIVMIRLAGKQSRSREHRRRLLATGTAASAVVLQVDETGPWYGRVPHLAFKLRVEPDGEPPFEATARGFFRPVDFARLQVGSRLDVRFDPTDRSAAAIVGDTLK